MTDDEKIEHLERQLDDALLKVFDLQSKEKTNSMVRFELEEMLRSIYYECLRLKESEERPAMDELLNNLSTNIRRLFEDYRIKF